MLERNVFKNILFTSQFVSFHTTAINLKRWRDDEYNTLSQGYQEMGPSWDLIADKLPGRTPSECRRKHHMLNISTDFKNTTEMNLYYEGYEKHDDVFIDIPIEKKGARSHLAYSYISLIPFVKSRSQHKKIGWHPTEDMAIKEAYDTYGPNWEKVAEELRHRTPIQCKNRLIYLYRFLNVAPLKSFPG